MMKQIVPAFALLLVLAACGASSWTAEQKASFVTPCVASTTSGARAVPREKAEQICNCSADGIAAKYSYEDVQKGNYDKNVVVQIATECASRAGLSSTSGDINIGL